MECSSTLLILTFNGAVGSVMLYHNVKPLYKEYLNWIMFKISWVIFVVRRVLLSEHTDRNVELWPPVLFRTNYYSIENLTWCHRSLYLSFSPCKATNIAISNNAIISKKENQFPKGSVNRWGWGGGHTSTYTWWRWGTVYSFDHHVGTCWPFLCIIVFSSFWIMLLSLECAW